MIARIKKILKHFLVAFNKKVFNLSIPQKDFCIFSNDCWGAEIYRAMEIPYNTPFVGLMLMAPCYIKLLKDPHKYFESKLEFIPESRYELINELRNKNGKFPIGKILDIEIHFQHYKSEEEATEKWNRRKSRINWDNILVKFTMDKDYATEELLSEFDDLPYLRKVCFSKFSYPNSASCIKINKFVDNGLIMFGLCMRQFDIAGWIKNGNIHFYGLSKLRGILLSYSLIR